jgi:hypothetical protein
MEHTKALQPICTLLDETPLSEALERDTRAFGQSLEFVLIALRQAAQPGQRPLPELFHIYAAVLGRARLDVPVDVLRHPLAQRPTERKANFFGTALDTVKALRDAVHRHCPSSRNLFPSCSNAEECCLASIYSTIIDAHSPGL